MRTLNLGILAHVDAGKTTLTERLLYAAGVIDRVGSVDHGTTQTDFLALEQRRGITIKSAVVSFVANGVTVNLIDTPGHPDFIAEVERVLGVLDGAVLVVSAVEGVQAQTIVLMRTLQRLRIPTLIFVNKIDRRGARPAAVVRTIGERLTPAIIAMGEAQDLGAASAAFTPCGAADRGFRARLAELLADHDEAILAAWVGDENAITWRRLRAGLGAQTRRALAHPVYFGSAITGAGVDSLIAAVTELLPALAADVEGPVSGAVFKVERGPVGEKIAYARLFGGTVRARERLSFGGDKSAKVTAIRIFDAGATTPCETLEAGRIGKLWGLGDVRIGDRIGEVAKAAPAHHFAPPTLETVIVPRRPCDKGALHAALVQLAEQDPLIDLRQDDVRQEMSVSLYGEVQKEVIQETLTSEFGLEVDFRETTTICIERPLGSGAAVEQAPRPLMATVGLRIDPGPVGSGVSFALEVEYGSLPLTFHKAVEEAALETLRQGLHGWRVQDCKLALTHAIRWRHFALSTPADHRDLTPLVVMDALRRAGTVVCEPMHRFHLEAPAEALGALLPILARLGAEVEAPATRGSWLALEGAIAAGSVHELRRRLPAATRGEGVLESTFDHYRPIRGPVPTRPRTDNNPLDRREYLRRLRRRS